MLEDPEISAQQKYKMELQAEINKLRAKYQDINPKANMYESVKN